MTPAELEVALQAAEASATAASIMCFVMFPLGIGLGWIACRDYYLSPKKRPLWTRKWWWKRWLFGRKK